MHDVSVIESGSVSVCMRLPALAVGVCVCDCVRGWVGVRVVSGSYLDRTLSLPDSGGLSDICNIMCMIYASHAICCWASSAFVAALHNH